MLGSASRSRRPPGSGSGIGSGSGSSPTSSLASSRRPTTWPRPSGRIERPAKRSRGSPTPIAGNMPGGSKTPRSPRPVSAGSTRRSSNSGPAPSTPERPLHSLSALICLAGRHCLRRQGVAASPPWLATFSTTPLGSDEEAPHPHGSSVSGYTIARPRRTAWAWTASTSATSTVSCGMTVAVASWRTTLSWAVGVLGTQRSGSSPGPWRPGSRAGRSRPTACGLLASHPARSRLPAQRARGGRRPRTRDDRL